MTRSREAFRSSVSNCACSTIAIGAATRLGVIRQEDTAILVVVAPGYACFAETPEDRWRFYRKWAGRANHAARSRRKKVSTIHDRPRHDRRIEPIAGRKLGGCRAVERNIRAVVVAHGPRVVRVDVGRNGWSALLHPRIHFEAGVFVVSVEVALVP